MAKKGLNLDDPVDAREYLSFASESGLIEFLEGPIEWLDDERAVFLAKDCHEKLELLHAPTPGLPN
jgi:hypothetical protein